MSLQSQRIREKFRKEIRARQVEQLMKIHRARAIRECLEFHTFTELDKKIIENSKQKICMQIITQLTTLLDTHPQNQNTYILISNYLIDHADATKYFESKMFNNTQVAYSLDNYKRALLIMMAKNEEINDIRINDYDYALAQVFHFSNNYRQINDCFKILQIILSLQTFSKQKKYIPKKFMIEFFEKLRQFNVPNLQADTKYYIIQTICHIGIDHLDNPLIHQNYIHDIISVVIMGIAQYPKFRTHLIFVLKTIIVDYYQQFQKILNTQLAEHLFRQLAYIHENLPRERPVILTIFNGIVNRLSLNMVFRFLNLRLHLIVVCCIKELSADQMMTCISTIIMLFDKIVSTQQPDLLQKVQDSLEEYQKFQTNVTSIFNQKLDPELQKLIQKLIDEFYTYEVN